MLDLTPHADEKRLFSVLRRRPEVDRMQALAMSIIERNASCHCFPPLLIADQHTGAVNTDADRRYLADLRRGVAPGFFLRLHDRPDMCGQILQTGLEAGPAMVLLQVFQYLSGGAAGEFVRHDLGKPWRCLSDDPRPVIHRAEGLAAFGRLVNMTFHRNYPIGRVENLPKFSFRIPSRTTHHDRVTVRIKFLPLQANEWVILDHF